MPERLVIADTSPLLYLHKAQHLDLLRRLYGTVAVPTAVSTEIEEGRRRGFDVPNIASIPWIAARSISDRRLLPAITDLGPGEAEAIALGLEYPGSLVLLDDRLARRIALLSGVVCTGTLGVLLKAKSVGLLPLVRPVLEVLRGHGMRIHDDLVRRVLAIAQEE